MKWLYDIEFNLYHIAIFIKQSGLRQMYIPV